MAANRRNMINKYNHPLTGGIRMIEITITTEIDINDVFSLPPPPDEIKTFKDKLVLFVEKDLEKSTTKITIPNGNPNLVTKKIKEKIIIDTVSHLIREVL